MFTSLVETFFPNHAFYNHIIRCGEECIVSLFRRQMVPRFNRTPYHALAEWSAAAIGSRIVKSICVYYKCVK